MAKQTFTVGQVLTAQQVNDLQTNDFNQTVSAKTASYTLVAADKGTRITMSSTSATTITVNTGLFAAGDTLFIQNLNTGVCTITAGTATVSTSATLALAQYEGGTLYFTSAGVSIFFKAAGAAAGGGGKVLQVVQGSYSTITTVASTSLTDTGLSLAITPTSATSKVLVLVTQSYNVEVASNINISFEFDIKRGATSVFNQPINAGNYWNWDVAGLTWQHREIFTAQYLDSPATTSATTYKTQGRLNNTTNRVLRFQGDNGVSTITLLEIGA